MEKTTIENWWASLKISEKERIALKMTGRQVRYPECTDVWEGLDSATKEKIYWHCSIRHGDILKDWDEGNPYGN